MITIIYCMLICYLGIWASCNKRFDCRGTIHTFEAFYRAYPAKDSIHIGDTIWIDLQTSTQLKDLLSGKTVDYSKAANLGTVMGYFELTGGDLLNPGANPAANDFENILVAGSTIAPLKAEQEREFNFKEENGMYLFKLGIVSKKTGLYMIGFSDAANVYQKGNSCDKSGFKLTFKDTDQHLYLLEQSRPGYTVSEYERTHAYCFKVY